MHDYIGLSIIAQWYVRVVGLGCIITTMTEKKQQRKLIKYGLPAIGICVVAIVAVITAMLLRAQPSQTIDTNKYQVVYLANGQAYFGKLQNSSGDFLIMKTPYTPQGTTSDTSNTASSNQGALLKVSDQLYGPEDSIAIKASQVAFWQNLRDDSKVTQAIKSKE